MEEIDKEAANAVADATDLRNRKGKNTEPMAETEGSSSAVEVRRAEKRITPELRELLDCWAAKAPPAPRGSEAEPDPVAEASPTT